MSRDRRSVEEQRAYKYDPVKCEDCGEFVVVTRNEDATSPDETTKFECECRVGSIAAVKPESWNGGEFL